MSAIQRVLNMAELLSMILASTRDRIQADRGMKATIEEPLLDDAEVKWKFVFRDVAFVNRAFFLASADFLWEHMHSLEPFLVLLGPSNTDSEPLAYGAGIAESSWQRFELYSSRTRSLALGVPKLSYSAYPCWTYYWMVSNGPPIFPALKKLYLSSADNLSMMIAFSVLSHIKLLHVDLKLIGVPERESKEAVTSLTAALAERPGSVSVLRFLQQIDTQCIQNLSRLQGLAHLHIALSNEDAEVVRAEPNFWSHSQALFQEAAVGAESWTAIHQRLRNLERPGRHISVLGGKLLHNKLTNHHVPSFSPPPYNTVYLDFTYSGNPDEVLPSSADVATYLSLNQRLTALQVRGTPGKTPHSVAMDRARSDPLFNNAQPLITQLTAAHNLQILSITRMFFPPGDIVLQMFSVLKHLPCLTMFTFVPFGLNWRTDGFLLPSLSILADIPKHNPLLRVLSGFMDLSAQSVNSAQLPAHHAPGRHLQQLDLFPGLPAEFPIYSTKETLALAMYLYRLFPNIDEISTLEGTSPLIQSFWGPIDQAIASFRQVRRLSILELFAA
ncbi:hypothetical protein NMY22_g679 [Coprinellus aureogranulatus]|nr:hypothetical protein NMY22_g679 [Coprinellus aureogranulatus]